MALTILLAVGVSATPVFSRINAGREFTNSYEIIYNVTDGEEKDADETSVNKVVDEFRARLDAFNVEDYSVKLQADQNVKEGDKGRRYAIEVSFAGDESEFEYIAKYLSFSGGNFSLIGEKEEQFVTNVFDNCEAYITKAQDTIPYVIIPISDKTQVEQFLKTVDPEDEDGEENPSEGDPTKLGHLYADEQDQEGEGEEEKETPNVFLVSDWDDADSYENAQKDPHIANKILMEFSSKHFWYEDSEEEHTEIQYLCGTADESGNYDLNNLKFANLKALYLKNMFNASSYELTVENEYVSVSASGYTYNYNQIKATNEQLLLLSSDVNIALSTTLISTLIAIAIVSLLLVVFYRLSAIAVIANTIGTIFLTYVVFVFMGALFNIPALIGGVILAATSLFGSIFYLYRFKEEVMKGRTIRKANQEASKKSNLLTIDASVIMAFTGLMLYVLGGVALKPMGVVLFFGALFALAMNLIVFKIMMYLLTNTTSLQNKYSYFAIDEKDVPSVLEDKKSEPKAAYENVNFTKRSKLFAVILSLLTVASIAGIVVFGTLKGSPLNVEKATSDYTVVYVNVNSDNKIITDEESFKDYVLKNILVDGSDLSYGSDAVDYQKITKFDSDSLQVEAEPYYIFSVDLDGVISPKEVTYTLDGTNYVVAEEGLTQAITNIIADVENINLEDKIDATMMLSHEEVSTPNQGYIALATGIAILGAGLYVALRFRVSRGIALVFVSGAASATAYGLLVLTRIGTTAYSAIVMPIVAISTILFALFYVSKEKELFRENKEGLDLEKRKEIMKRALSLSASGMIVMAIVAIYIAINYFGFGLASTAYMFAALLVGDVFGLVAVLTIMGPFGALLDKMFSKIKLPQFTKKEKKQRIKLHEQPKTSEPEERVFIGIND